MPSKKSAKNRIVLDTNNLVSAQINASGVSRRIYKAFLQGDLVVVTSSFQINEFKKVLYYKRIKEKFKLSSEDINIILNKFVRYATIVYPESIEKIIPEDPDDDKILAIAVEGKAEYIVSGDSHLLKLGNYQKIPILTAQEFYPCTRTPRL